jgi:hypothetical protein
LPHISILSDNIRARGVAQLVARTAGGREVAGSSPVTPTMKKAHRTNELFSWRSVLALNSLC